MTQYSNQKAHNRTNSSKLFCRVGSNTAVSHKAEHSVLFYTEGWGTGGIESLIMSMVSSSAWKESQFTFDIFNVCDWSQGYDSQIESLGGQRFVCFPDEKPGLSTRFKRGLEEFEKLASSRQYVVAHINATNGLNFSYANIARKAGIPVRIMHSHNSSFDNVGEKALAKTIAHKLGRTLWGDSATECIACSLQAGRFVFGNMVFETVPNAIDCSRFRFRSEHRKRTRLQLGLNENNILVGNIGRIDIRKNPQFQIRVFAALKQIIPEARYLMVGDGEEKGAVSHLAEELGVGEDLIIKPATSNPELFYCALDALLMPSIEEGFGLTAVEAQCSGLPVLASDALPESVMITQDTLRMPIKDGTHAWAKELSQLLAKRASDRDSSAQIVENAGFGIDTYARKMIDRYNRLLLNEGGA